LVFQVQHVLDGTYILFCGRPRLLYLKLILPFAVRNVSKEY